MRTPVENRGRLLVFSRAILGPQREQVYARVFCLWRPIFTLENLFETNFADKDVVSRGLLHKSVANAPMFIPFSNAKVSILNCFCVYRKCSTTTFSDTTLQSYKLSARLSKIFRHNAESYSTTFTKPHQHLTITLRP